nr:Chain A, PrP peptide [synthetic construct]4W67_B Chain B, PrP peptide [synthetic construct]
GYVLGSA